MRERLCLPRVHRGSRGGRHMRPLELELQPHPEDATTCGVCCRPLATPVLEGEVTPCVFVTVGTTVVSAIHQGCADNVLGRLSIERERKLRGRRGPLERRAWFAKGGARG